MPKFNLGYPRTLDNVFNQKCSLFGILSLFFFSINCLFLKTRLLIPNLETASLKLSCHDLEQRIFLHGIILQSFINKFWCFITVYCAFIPNKFTNEFECFTWRDLFLSTVWRASWGRHFSILYWPILIFFFAKRNPIAYTCYLSSLFKLGSWKAGTMDLSLAQWRKLGPLWRRNLGSLWSMPGPRQQARGSKGSCWAWRPEGHRLSRRQNWTSHHPTWPRDGW